jgi:hypothetical protein
MFKLILLGALVVAIDVYLVMESIAIWRIPENRRRRRRRLAHLYIVFSALTMAIYTALIVRALDSASFASQRASNFSPAHYSFLVFTNLLMYLGLAYLLVSREAKADQADAQLE